MEIGESLKTFINEEIKKAMDNCVGDFIGSHVLMKKNHNIFSCEIDVHVASGFSIRSNGRDEDPYACVSHAINILKQRTKRYKARLLGSMRRTKEQTMSVSQFIIANSQEEEKIQDNPVIIAEMPDAMEIMSVGDAVMRLDLSELPVLIFKNINSGQVNVLFKRQDGNIGWVAPKAD